jgi:hypothetical protein
MTKQMQALLTIATHPSLEEVLLPAINISREEFNLQKVKYETLSTGIQTAVSWAWCIWKDMQTSNTDEGIRDPFEGFGNMSRDLQRLVLHALLVRHGYPMVHVSTESKGRCA